MSAILLVALLVSLFGLAYVTRRRFGVLGLALAAGSLLSANWAGTLTPFLEQQGLTLTSPPLAIVVQSALILMPPLLLLFSGPAYREPWQRIAGALAFSLLAFAFLLTPFGSYVRLDQGQDIYNALKNYQSIIIVAGLILALGDILLTRKKHHKASGH